MTAHRLKTPGHPHGRDRARAPDARRVITLYTKPGCHLCEDALAVLLRVRADIPFQLSQQDITADERLHRSYFERIPVIVLDGEELFDYFVDEPLLRERLTSAS